MNPAQKLLDSFTPGLVSVNGKLLSDPTKKPFWKGGLAFLNQLPVHDAVTMAETMFCLAVKKELQTSGLIGAEQTDDTPRAMTAAIYKVIAQAIERKDIVGFDPRTGKITVAWGVEIAMPTILSNGAGGIAVVPSNLGEMDRVQEQIDQVTVKNAERQMILQTAEGA